MNRDSLDVPATRTLRAVPLTRPGFAPYGEVIQPEGGRVTSVNDGRALRHDDLASLAHATGAERPVLSLYRVSPSDRPFRAGVFECHPLSSQVFLPMADAEFLVVVAPDRDGAPDLDRAEAFVPGRRTGIHYRPGIWHVPLAAFGFEAVFAMLMWEAGTADTVEHRLAAPLIVEF
jgi:ureidoglycolate lyase